MHSDPSRRIALLPPDVANQIAAGEVVERPASIVKELLENALDAGAHTVTVTVDDGGLARIAVVDDGAGMDADDLAMSVVRHATSKIRTAGDLVGVGTYGFRGEALPSIASVSRLRMSSRTADVEHGHELTVEAGGFATVKPTGTPVGTTVSVEDLFFNTPARRKFLRSPATEAAQCVETVVRLALPRPDVRFVVRRDGKTVREFLRGDDVAHRAREVYKGETLTEIRGSRGSLRLTALLGPPERARAGAASLVLYVNGRNVKDRVLLRAVAQAYGSTLEGGRYPMGAVLLEVPAQDVDVNVHPQKSEVRFAAVNEIFAAIASIVREHLSGAPWARARAADPAGGGASTSPSPTFPLRGGDLWTGRFEPGPRTEPERASGALGAFVQPSGDADPWGITPRAPYPPVAYDTTVAPPPPEGPPPITERLLPEGTFASLRYVSQLRRMFLLCEGETGVVILDQHAAAERVTFHRLKRAYGARSVAVQPMLVAESIEVTPSEVALVEERQADLARIGMELVPVGPTTLSVRAVPALMVRADPRRLARDVLSELARQGNDFSRAVDLVLATMACHGSVRAGDDLADEEARALLRALDDVEFAGHCPHGRPVVWSIGWGELERRVGR